MKIEIGEKAPDFSLPDEGGDTVSLATLAGQWVVLYFYPKDNTSGCSIEAQEFSSLKGKFGEEGAAVYGVSADSAESHRKFIGKKGLSITLLSDEGKKCLSAYGVWQKKKMAGREYFGIVRSTFLIDPRGKVAYLWDKVKAKGHAEEVLEKLKELRAGK